MGWHYILRFTCKVLPEYIQFIENEYMQTQYKVDEDELENIFLKQLYYHYGPDYLDSNEVNEKIDKWKEERKQEKEIQTAEYNLLPKKYKNLLDIWNSLDIGNHFYDYNLNGDIFYCKISKKVNSHKGDLRDDYKTFLKDIIVHISSEIESCQIESDDYGDQIWHYTDSELRNIHFNLQDKVKGIEHTYSEDGNEILETRVVYKHSIKKTQLIDLNRLFGV